MQHLIQYLVREHLPQIAAKSLMNCHVKGVHSIMFIDSPEQRIRLFVATDEHELWRNTLGSLGSLAAHAHHCNVTLHCVKGLFTNLEYIPSEDGRLFRAFRYVSGILHKQGSFEASEKPGVVLDAVRLVLKGSSLALPAHRIHSVRVPKGVVAAWFVYESREDDAYESLSYSDQPLSAASFEGLYQPMSEAQVLDLLRLAGLLGKQTAK